MFPIDGDCKRFLLCRKDRRSSEKIRGKVYKCPKGELAMQNSNLVSYFLFAEIFIFSTFRPLLLAAMAKVQYFVILAAKIMQFFKD